MGSGPCRCRQSNEVGFCPAGPTQPIPLVLVINIALGSLPLSPSSRWSVSSAKVGQSVNSTLPAMETAPEMEEANSGKSQVLGEKKIIFSPAVAASVMGQKELADVLPLGGPA